MGLVVRLGTRARVISSIMVFFDAAINDERFDVWGVCFREDDMVESNANEDSESRRGKYGDGEHLESQIFELESKFNISRCYAFYCVRRNEDPSLSYESVATTNTRTEVPVVKSRNLLCSVL